MDELNQVQDENLFDDVEETTETEVEPEAEVVEETAEAAPFLKVTYDKEEKNLSEDEAREYAQKGMNYDRVKGRYDELNARLDQLARLNGLSVEEYLNALGDTQTEFMVDSELDKLKEQYPNDSEEVLREIAQRRVNENLNLSAQKEQGKADALEVEMRRQVDMFREEYPDVDIESIAPDVFDFVKNGYTLLEAYNKFSHIQQAKEQPAIEARQKAEKLNEDNKRKSLGNTGTAGNVDSDDFLNGFLKG